MTNLINTAYALIESGDAQSKAHGQGMLEVIQKFTPMPKLERPRL
jgi:hypothetical protein